MQHRMALLSEMDCSLPILCLLCQLAFVMGKSPTSDASAACAGSKALSNATQSRTCLNKWNASHLLGYLDFMGKYPVLT